MYFMYDCFCIDSSMQLSQGANIPIENVLKERLPKDMFISPSNLSVSLEIGQGNSNRAIILRLS